MIIVMRKWSSEESVQRVVDTIRSRGLREHISRGEERTIIGALGDERVFHSNELARLPDVERVFRVLNDWKIISREGQPEDSKISIGLRMRMRDLSIRFICRHGLMRKWTTGAKRRESN